MNNPEFFPDNSEQIDNRQALMQAWNSLAVNKELAKLTLEDRDFSDGYSEKPTAEHGSKAYEFNVSLLELDIEKLANTGDTLGNNGDTAEVGIAFWAEHGGQRARFFDKLPSIPMFTLSYTPFIVGDRIDSIENGITYKRVCVFMHVMPDGKLLSQAHLMAYDEEDNYYETYGPFTEPAEPSLAELVSFKTILNQVNMGHLEASPYGVRHIDTWWPGGEDFWCYDQDIQAEHQAEQ